MLAEQLEPIDHLPLFANLPPNQLAWVKERLYRKVFPANMDIIMAGSAGEVIFIIMSGSVKVYVPQVDGRQVTIAILGPGETVGEMSLVDSAGRSASVVTLEESALLWMSRSHFQEAIHTIPMFAQNLLTILTHRLRLSSEQIQSLSVLDVNGRIARQLLSFANYYGVKGPNGEMTIPINLTQGEIANMVGASRKRVNQVMVNFKRNNWIYIDPNYRITILNKQALMQVFKIY